VSRRVVITGCGVICALGDCTLAFARALASGHSGIGPLEQRFASGQSHGSTAQHAGARVAPSLAAETYGYERALLDPVSQYALAAGREACEQSQLLDDPELSARAGVYVGTGTGGASSIERTYADMFGLGAAPRPLAILRAMNNAPASHLSMRFGLQGPNLTFSAACASSATAIGEAFHAIRSGRLDGALAGGTEACLVTGVLRAWESLRVLAAAHAENPAASCRPFSRNRGGIVLGEGSAMFVLETIASAKRRAVPVLAELLGYGATADALHITNPSVDGQARAMSAALVDAKLAPDDIDYVNAHGTATRIGDECETLAIKRVFGRGAYRIPVSSTKSVHGHLLGGAGALEFAACIVAARGGFLPATMHLSESDPGCDLDYVANAPRHGVSLRRFMSNSFAFGGSNAVLIGGKYE
jgi:3-oxoacyl-[acyl-carrier-protein] synthase II